MARRKSNRILLTLLLTMLLMSVFSSCSKSSTEGKTMIADKLENANKYFRMHPDFEKAFAFLNQDSLAVLPVGRYKIDGERIFAMIDKKVGKGRGDAKLEAHRKYIDIQYVISGTDEMGWRPTSACTSVESPYDENNDIGFFNDLPQTWNKVEAGHFTIFTPEDAHAPMVSTGEIHKVVIKVRKAE